MIEEITGEETHALSYSSASLLAKCEQKYCYYKVEKIKPDIDADTDTYAFRFGKAFHKVMEITYHNYEAYNHKILLAAIDEYELHEEDIFRVYACCRLYYEAAEQAGIKIVITELEFKTDETYGFIDGIGFDEKGKFWIVDLKTTSRYQTLLPTRLARDPQLSLYACHLEQIVDALREKGYDVTEQDFAGVSYRAVSKPEHVVYTNDTPDSYYERVRGSKRKTSSDNRVVFIDILAQYLDVKTLKEEHTKLYRRSVELRSGDTPKRNYNNCIDYNKTCEYFSQCYGHTATEMSKIVNVSTLQSVTNVAKLVVTEETRRDEMLNISVKNCSWFPSEKTARIDVEVAFGVNGPTLSRPFYYNGDINADFMNSCIVEAMQDAKIAFWMHLSNLRKDDCYQSWAGIFKPHFAVPPAKDAKVSSEPPAVVKEEPKPVAAKPAKAAPVKEEVEEVEEEEEAPKPAKAAKPVKAEKKKVDEVLWTSGDKAKSIYMKAILDDNWVKDWHKKPKFVEKAKAIGKALEEAGIVLLRDGEVTEEFTTFVENEL